MNSSMFGFCRWH